MNCAACGFVIQSGFAFCPKCGAKQPISCAACGQQCAPDFLFCPRCGKSLSNSSAASPEPAVPESVPATRGLDDAAADRRPLTVLFADLCGFTTLSEQFDPELMRSLQNELFDELSRCVVAYGGFVDKFVGDALLALFGAPTAHEDDPHRALCAAMDMERGVAELGARRREFAGIPLQLHIGINTGPVVTGSFGTGGARSYSVTGDTVNTAQRLQSLAAPGEILVGPVTHRLTRHAFGFENLGTQELRGKSGIVAVHRLVGALETPHAARGLESLGLRAETIGRDAELARMTDCLELACAGSAQLVQLVGEAGIGKSRLVRDFLARIEEDDTFTDVVVRCAVCSPLGDQSYGTLASVLRSAYGIANRESAAKTVELLTAGLRGLGFPEENVAELSPLLFCVFGFGDPGDALRHLEPEQLRRQIFYATRTIIERRLAISPLVLVVEDMHWADAASIDALRFVLDRLERTRLMMVTTARSSEEGEGLASNRTNRTILRLAPLSLPDGERLLSQFFGAELPTDIRSGILTRSGGNPLFIEEIVRSLIDTGMVVSRDGAWAFPTGDGGAEIPMSLQAMLLARIDRLPADTRRLLQEAAVVGPRFEAVLLQAVASDRANVEADLDALCAAEILVEEVRGPSGGTYAFTQTLLHDVVYHNLLLQRRKELHGRIGVAMERLLPAGLPRLEDVALLGHHFRQADEVAKGAHYLTEAGDLAGKAYANDDAMRLYLEAFAAIGERGDMLRQRLMLCERLADLCSAAGDRTAARGYCEEALAAYRACDDRLAAARMLRKLGRLDVNAGRRDLADAFFMEASTCLEGMPASIELAHLLQERGHLAFRQGDHQAAARWADEALACLEDVNLTNAEAAQARAEALNTKGVALARLGYHRQAVGEVEASLRVAEQAQLLRAACRAYSNLGVLYAIVDPASAIKVCRRGLDLAIGIADLGFQARLHANLAVACCTFTDRCASEGLPAAERAIEIDRALDQRDHLAVPLIVLGQIHQCHGELRLARRCYQEALQLAVEIGEPQLLFPCYDGLATLDLETDDMASAEHNFALAKDVCVRHGLDPDALVVLPFLD
ncbi:adenylate cyclase [Rhizobium sp. Root708]|uniref:adenylate/guanylate cyclase domain-containing protein n=1 Tax=Rhizobium sp. Root708 TaxID=1736592 RepID=UPI0006F79CE9|nr:adenylate/guanylate cyclase domain-containing protein [Rhizobium sp. Root708]KRB50851.1 adenylate cyclase [Rhizobium sp. Root708]